jgi:hypothetical protein
LAEHGNKAHKQNLVVEGVKDRMKQEKFSFECPKYETMLAHLERKIKELNDNDRLNPKKSGTHDEDAESEEEKALRTCAAQLTQRENQKIHAASKRAEAAAKAVQLEEAGRRIREAETATLEKAALEKAARDKARDKRRKVGKVEQCRDCAGEHATKDCPMEKEDGLSSFAHPRRPISRDQSTPSESGGASSDVSFVPAPSARAVGAASGQSAARARAAGFLASESFAAAIKSKVELERDKFEYEKSVREEAREAALAQREAALAEREEAREAALAEREEAREAAKAEREAADAEREIALAERKSKLEQDKAMIALMTNMAASLANNK